MTAFSGGYNAAAANRILHGLCAPALCCARRPPTRALFARLTRACSLLRPPPANPGAVCTAYARLLFVAPAARQPGRCLHGLCAPVLRCARRPPTRALFARLMRACSLLRPPPANPGAVCTAYAHLFFVAPAARQPGRCLHGLCAPVLRYACRPPTRALFARLTRTCSLLHPKPANPGAVCTAYAHLFFVAPAARQPGRCLHGLRAPLRFARLRAPLRFARSARPFGLHAPRAPSVSDEL
ncbi:MAG: hypothetical protein DU429_03485 [Candidatus Tokpelaia sp.]|nr:MAG: hypothetical protein DU430_01350 [Candidatus Tokpelaia sp.]KAA6207171.1 MAG: hypothetical protein DU429_03485 [Candidatus Tokpelaia sp.]